VAEGRRFELLCAEATAVFGTAGPPFARPFRIGPGSGSRTHHNGFAGRRLADQHSLVAPQRRFERRMLGLEPSHLTIGDRGVVQEPGFEPGRTRNFKARRYTSSLLLHGAGGGIRTHRHSILNRADRPILVHRRTWCAARDSNSDNSSV
jgi:hypothetical protein